MTADDVRSVRLSMGLTQTQFGRLLGVHGLTVSKWERGVLGPPHYQQALISSFRTAAERRPDIGETIAALLVGAGLGVALFETLRAAFEPEKRRR